MQVLWLAALLLHLLYCRETEQTQGKDSHEGTEFVLVLQDNKWRNSSNALYVTTSSAGDVTVNVTYRGEVKDTVTVSVSSFGVVELPDDLRISGTTQTSNFTVLVTSSHPISVWAQNFCEYSTDTSLILPVNRLGHHYVAVTMAPEYKAQVAVVAVEDGTRVFIVTAEATPVTFSRTLNRLEAFQVDSVEDLTGSTIAADRPVAVFSGNVKAAFPETLYDHLYEQLYPMKHWGKRFLTVPTRQGHDYDNDTYVIIASQNGTNVTISGHEQYALDACSVSQEVNLTAARPHVITSDQPVLVVKIMRSVHHFAHPCMAQIVPNGQWLNNYEFRTSEDLEDVKFVDIWILGTAQALKDVSLNGANFLNHTNTECMRSMPDLCGQPLYLACVQKVDLQISVLLRTSSGLKFAAHAHTWGGSVSMCHALGRGFFSQSESSDNSTTNAEGTSCLVQTAVTSLTQDSTFVTSDTIDLTQNSLETWPSETLYSSSSQPITLISLASTVQTIPISTQDTPLPDSSTAPSNFDPASVTASQDLTESPTTTLYPLWPTETTWWPGQAAESSTDSSSASTVPSSDSAAKGTYCSCQPRCSITKAVIMAEELSLSVQRLQSELLVDTRNTSASRRKRASVPDDRTTSKVMGYAGIVVILAVLLGLIISDIPNLVGDFRRGLKKG